MPLALARAALATVLLAQAAAAFAVDTPECIAPAKPGGGFDLTCRLAQASLREAGLLREPLRITYMPGGIGAVAYNAIVAQRPAEPNTIVAFSGGSLLNLAQGKFGKWSESNVRWLASVGADYGMIAVRSDSAITNLRELMAAIRRDPARVVFGAGGTVGSQDWVKLALIARQVGYEPRNLRYVSFEGGGEAFAALLGGHVQAVSGDVSEAAQHLESGRIRVLAVFSESRLPGRFAAIPTAREQGHDLVWPIIRGFYMGPKVSDLDYRRWADMFAKVMDTPVFAELRSQSGLFSYPMTGAALDAYVHRTVREYSKVAAEFGLIRP